MDAPERAALVRGSGTAVSRVARAAGDTHAAVLGVVRTALTPLGPAARIPVDLTRAVSAANYATVAGTARAVSAVGAPLVASTAAATAVPASTQPSAVAWLAALSAAFGDRMVVDPGVRALTVPMGLRRSGLPVDPAEPGPATSSGTLVILVHGLGSHESMWSDEYLHVVEAAGAVPLTVRYTTGQAIVDSGAELADLLDEVVARWPVPIEQILLVGHSMGGLVIRSALARGGSWRNHVQTVVTLGTPHRGAPLERAARTALGVAARIPVAAPIASLGDERSAGIKDLAFADVPEPDPEVAWHLVAGSLPGARAEGLLGDGLVPRDSAFGVPRDRVTQTVTIEGADHLALLGHPNVAVLLAGLIEVD